ncbi:hypothetical protein ILUMI_08542 [Ignelater luminosus]|uniref:Mannosyltransferase n=1 Tax=Ignelater luminosus TaxID=2038154 RepID=A0A8K0GAJ1_IGNLU|nr:hypothetical protein ILUMI_08542 [Ignelater luminosus]
MVNARYNYLPTVRSIKGLMTTSILAPLAILSIFPHQEPRFLIPLILPFVYLYGARILPEREDILVKSYKFNRKSQKKKHESYTLFKIWIVINVILTLFYGFIHQGGVFPFVSHLSTEMKVADYGTKYHVITSHIYSIPESLFLQKVSPYGIRMQPKRLFMYEEGSNQLTDVLKKISALLSRCRVSSLECKVYLVIPNSLIDSLEYNIYKDNKSNLVLNNTVSFYPHLSVEALPSLYNINAEENYKTILTRPIFSLIRFVESFGLSCIEFTLKVL